MELCNSLYGLQAHDEAGVEAAVARVLALLEMESRDAANSTVGCTGR